MQLIIKGGYFGATNKFQKAYTHAFKHSSNHASKQSKRSIPIHMMNFDAWKTFYLKVVLYEIN
jgi:hypothetical protein